MTEEQEEFKILDLASEEFDYLEPEGKGMVGDVSKDEASTGSKSKNWTHKTAEFGPSSKTKEELEAEHSLTAEQKQEIVQTVAKQYKKIKKYKKSNMRIINQLSGKKDIIDRLMDEYKTVS